MLRIIFAACCAAGFAMAAGCDFSDRGQGDCELNIHNPPIFLHNFVDSNNATMLSYEVCKYDGQIEIFDEFYEVIDCSSVEKEGLLTEGVILENTSNGVKNITIDSNTLLVVAGNFILDSGIKISQNASNKLIIEMLEGSNGRSYIVMQRGAELNAQSIIMPNGEKASIEINTLLHDEGIFTNPTPSLSQYANLSTAINVDSIYSVSQSGDSVDIYNGNITCGNEVLIPAGVAKEATINIKDSTLGAANIKSQNSGLCRVAGVLMPSDVAIQVANAKLQATQDSASTQDFVESTAQATQSTDSVESTESTAPQIAQNAESPSPDSTSAQSQEPIAQVAPDSAPSTQTTQALQTPQSGGITPPRSIQTSRLSMENPPIFLHKFIDSNNQTSASYESCKYDGNIKILDESYEVIDCSMVKHNNRLTEGMTIDKNLELGDKNILLIAAGDLVLDSGVKISQNASNKLVLEMLEGSNGTSNITLKDGAEMDVSFIIMPSGENHSIDLDNRIGTKTALNSSGIYSIAPDGETIMPYGGSVVCGDIDLKNSKNSVFLDNANIVSQNNGNCLLADGTIARDSTAPRIASAPSATTPNTQTSPSTSAIAQASPAQTAPSASPSVDSTKSPDSIALAPASQKPLDSTPSEVPSQDANIADSAQSTKDSAITQTAPSQSVTPAAPSVDSAESLASVPSIREVAPIKPQMVASGNNDFLIIDSEYYESVRRECIDNQCLFERLLPYDREISAKVSSAKKANAIYVMNFSNGALDVNCEVQNHYGKNSQHNFKLDTSKTLDKIELRFPLSGDNKTKIVCQSPSQSKETNEIIVTPAKFKLNPIFGDGDYSDSVVLKAGAVNITFEDSYALTLEGEIDSGFNGAISANISDFNYKQTNRCRVQNSGISIPNALTLHFKNGRIPSGASLTIMANAVTNGKLDINFNIANCQNCAPVGISKQISVIPANFMIKTDIIAPHRISYYGQIDDRNSFKFNPIVDIKVNALNNQNEVIDLNNSCYKGSVVLTLDNDLLLEFKRSVTDRLNSKITIYGDEFDSKKTADVMAYFGITRMADEYRNVRKIKQNDVVEPTEIKLTDLLFKAQYRQNGKIYDYDKPVVYDRLLEDSTPASVLIARGNLEPTLVRDGERNRIIFKYNVFCESCDMGILARYMDVENLTMDTANWYVNTKHPSEFYLDNKYIKTNLSVENPNKTIEGYQEIIVRSASGGDFNLSINQQTHGFAPYLNYNKNFKNIYLEKAFNIAVNAANSGNRDNKIQEVFDKYIKDSRFNTGNPTQTPQ